MARSARLANQVMAHSTTPSDEQPARRSSYCSRVAPGQRASRRRHRDRAEDGQRRSGATKCLRSTVSLRSTRTQMLTMREDPQQQQCRRATEGRDGVACCALDTKMIRPKASSGGEHDRDPRRPAGRVHLAEERRQHLLAGHAVEQPAGHQHVDQRRVGHREHRDERQQLVDRDARAPPSRRR